jgi:hypothetical protein
MTLLTLGGAGYLAYRTAQRPKIDVDLGNAPQSVDGNVARAAAFDHGIRGRVSQAGNAVDLTLDVNHNTDMRIRGTQSESSAKYGLDRRWSYFDGVLELDRSDSGDWSGKVNRAFLPDWQVDVEWKSDGYTAKIDVPWGPDTDLTATRHGDTITIKVGKRMSLDRQITVPSSLPATAQVAVAMGALLIDKAEEASNASSNSNSNNSK